MLTSDDQATVSKASRKRNLRPSTNPTPNHTPNAEISRMMGLAMTAWPTVIDLPIGPPMNVSALSTCSVVMRPSATACSHDSVIMGIRAR